MRCHLIGSVMVERTQPATLCIMAAHMMLWSGFTMQPANVIEMHEHKGDFKEW